MDDARQYPFGYDCNAEHNSPVIVELDDVIVLDPPGGRVFGDGRGLSTTHIHSSRTCGRVFR